MQQDDRRSLSSEPEPIFQTEVDLKRVRHIGRQVTRSLENKFKALGPDRAVLIEHECPKEGPLTIGDNRPCIRMEFLRRLDDGNYAVEGALTMFPMIATSGDKKHLFALRGISIRRPGFPGKHSISDMVRSQNDTTLSLSKRLFQEIKKSGYIENQDFPSVPLDVARMDGPYEVPNLSIFDNLPRVEDIEVPATPAEQKQRRRLWTKREKYIREKAVRLKTAFQRQSGYLFKTVKIDVNPQTETFSLTFQAKAAFKGRFTRLDGTFGVEWDPKGHLAAEMTFQINPNSLRREFRDTVDLEPIDVVDEDMAASQLLGLLYETQALVGNSSAEAAERDNRLCRPTPTERRTAHRVHRRAARQTTNMMRFRN